MSWPIVCLIVALILFLLAAVGIGSNDKVHLGWAGAFFLTVALVLDGAPLGG